MNKVINNLIIIFCFLLIGFIIIFSNIPNFVLDKYITIGGFGVPIIIILITMSLQIKKENDIKEKYKIKIFWLKKLFIIYCFLLITILFLNNEYRFSKKEYNTMISNEYLETINIVPFKSIINYIINWHAKISMLNIGINLLLFMPMGFFIPLLFNDRVTNVKKFIIIMVIILFIIEIFQFITHTGSADIDDVLLNLMGSIIIYELVKKRLHKIIKY